MRDLSIEELKMLADCERGMDSGIIPYVVLNGDRCAIDHEILSHFGLINHQTIDSVIFIAIQKFNIGRLKKEIMDKESKRIETAKPEDFNDEHSANS